MVSVLSASVLLSVIVQLPTGTNPETAKRIRRDTLAFQPSDGVKVADVLSQSETGNRYAVELLFPTVDTFRDTADAATLALETFTTERYTTFTGTRTV